MRQHFLANNISTWWLELIELEFDHLIIWLFDYLVIWLFDYLVIWLFGYFVIPREMRICTEKRWIYDIYLLYTDRDTVTVTELQIQIQYTERIVQIIQMTFQILLWL